MKNEEAKQLVAASADVSMQLPILNGLAVAAPAKADIKQDANAAAKK